jgi:hypothetical protein
MKRTVEQLTVIHLQNSYFLASYTMKLEPMEAHNA